jgi:transcriptional regulator with XRE-family HTH domain
MASNNREMRIRALRAQGVPQREIARQLGISPRTVGRIESRLHQASPSPSPPTAPAPGPSEQSVGSPLERTPELPTEDVQGHAKTPDPMSRATRQFPERSPMGPDPRPAAGDGEADASALQPLMEELPHSAKQLYEISLRICQLEAQQLYQAQEQTRQAEAALHQALRGVQKARAGHWRLLREMTQSIGELLQAAGRLPQALPGEDQ